MSIILAIILGIALPTIGYLIGYKRGLNKGRASNRYLNKIKKKILDRFPNFEVKILKFDCEGMRQIEVSEIPINQDEEWQDFLIDLYDKERKPFIIIDSFKE